MSDWKSVSVPEGGKLIKVHNFTYMKGGNTFSLEVDEFPDGSFTGHGEQTSDASNVVESVTANTMKECLAALVSRIRDR